MLQGIASPNHRQNCCYSFATLDFSHCTLFTCLVEASNLTAADSSTWHCTAYASRHMLLDIRTLHILYIQMCLATVIDTRHT